MEGTAIGTALGASINRLRDHEARSRIVILLTDGENNSGALSPIAAAEVAKTLGVKVYTIATGKKAVSPSLRLTVRDTSSATVKVGPFIEVAAMCRTTTKLN